MPELDEPIAPHKAELIDWAVHRYAVRSLVDLGGCWGVNGGYTFHAARTHSLARAVLVDTSITQLTYDRAQDFSDVELVQGAFGSGEIVETVGEVDAAIFYDVLLHQVEPDWDDVLELYSERISTFIIFNQTWLGPNTVRFLDFGVEEYLDRVPHRNEQRIRQWFDELDDWNPDEQRPWRYAHNFWQWGITQRDLVSRLWDLGYRVDHLSHYGLYNLRWPEIELVGIVAHRRGESVVVDEAAAARAGPRFQHPEHQKVRTLEERIDGRLHEALEARLQARNGLLLRMLSWLARLVRPLRRRLSG